MHGSGAGSGPPEMHNTDEGCGPSWIKLPPPIPSKAHGALCKRGQEVCMLEDRVKSSKCHYLHMVWSGLLFSGVINTMNKSNSQTTGFLWLIIPGHTQSSKEVRAGTKTEAMLLTGSLATSGSASFLMQPWPDCRRMVSPQQIISQTVSHRHGHRPTWARKAILWLRFPLLWWLLSHVKLTQAKATGEDERQTEKTVSDWTVGIAVGIFLIIGWWGKSNWAHQYAACLHGLYLSSCPDLPSWWTARYQMK